MRHASAHARFFERIRTIPHKYVMNVCRRSFSITFYHTTREGSSRSEKTTSVSLYSSCCILNVTAIE